MSYTKIKNIFSKKTFFTLSASLFLLLTFSAKAHAADFYVDPLNGDDAHDGLTVATAKSTVNSVDGLVTPGSTVYLMDTADYTGSQAFHGSVSGTAGNPITIKSYNGGNPKFTGDGYNATYINLSGMNYYVVDGIEFRGAVSAVSNSITMTTGSWNTIKNCTFEYKQGMRILNADNNTIENNTAINIGGLGPDPFQGMGEFVFIFGGRNNIIQNNNLKSIGHSGITIQSYAMGTSNSREAFGNQVLHNIVDQRFDAAKGQNGGGGGIYIAVQAHHNIIDDNTIYGVGQLPGLQRNKAGIFIEGPNNVVTNNHIESYGVPGVELHRGIMVSVDGQYGVNLFGLNNRIEKNYIGPGYGLAIFLAEANLTRLQGVVTANNIFLDNEVTTPIEALTGSLIGMYTPSVKYPIYMYIHTAANGPWTPFANGNTFINTKFLKTDGTPEDGNAADVKIAYYYRTSGWAKSINTTISENPTVFYDDTAPLLISETEKIPSILSINNPTYTFSSPAAGTISYSGACSSQNATATVGTNVITLNALANGKYSDCTLQVTNPQSKNSNILWLGEFIVDLAAPSAPTGFSVL